MVSPGYFKTMRIPILRGRDFNDGDREDTQYVAIVNEEMARRYCRIRIRLEGISFAMVRSNVHSKWLGVAKNNYVNLMSTVAQPFLYVPLSQDYISIRDAAGAHHPST